MTDLANDLIYALERYDTTMSSWLTLRQDLEGGSYNRQAVPVNELDRALNTYINEQIQWLRLKNGTVEIDAMIALLPSEPLTNILVRAGRLSTNNVVDSLIVYAAHIAAGTAYREEAWTNIAEAVVAYAIRANEKELSRR